MAEPMTVELVATDRAIWSGQATLVSFSTLDGEVGLMPGHSPIMAVLRDGPVLIRQADGQELHAAVHTGFAVVDDGKVIILAESAELADEIDIDAANELLEQAKHIEDEAKSAEQTAMAQTQIRVAQKAS